jgi:gas vesicle protein
MAERSSELDEGAEIKVTRTDTMDEAIDMSDRNDSENRLTVNSVDDEDTNTDEVTDETEKIRTNIEETRSQLSETIDAIQERLSFSNISETVKDEVSEHISSAIQTAKDSVYDATLGKVGNVMNYVNKGMNEVVDTSVVRTARKNPLAIGLIGLGLGLLYMNSTQKRSQYRYNRNENDYDYDREGGYNRREFSSRDDQSAMRDNRSTLSTAQNKVSDVAGKVGETVSSATGAVSDTVSDVAGKAYKQVGNLGSQVKDVAGSAQDQYEYYMDENPLAVGAVALALGAAVGISIPSTRFEGELMGETRDNLMQKAEETARGTIDKVKSVAGEVTEKVKNVAGDVVQTVKDSAGDVTQTAKDEAKKQGLT